MENRTSADLMNFFWSSSIFFNSKWGCENWLVMQMGCQQVKRLRRTALKHAHKLNETVLKPKAFEKVNVKLAVALLHESTINTMRIYGFPETAMVLQLFSKLWSVLNVSSSTIGKHKRDITRDPVNCADDWKLDFLLEFEKFATVWKNSLVSFGFVLNK